ncbi:hypothetical protein C8R46DRAFT_1214057 [Mycena filopes]|nr:hypothetical protein C8R46DRAFT_1214057 [Mycena filopes]
MSGGSAEERALQYERWLRAETPMKVFVNDHREGTLDEMLRAEGRGKEEFYARCAECKIEDPLFRWGKQTCIGPGMYCKPCIIKIHWQLPTHMIEKWNENFFVPLMQNELEAEARIQLGHVLGVGCTRSQPAHKDFVVMDVLGIRVVKLSF